MFNQNKPLYAKAATLTAAVPKQRCFQIIIFPNSISDRLKLHFQWKVKWAYVNINTNSRVWLV